jgi:hypothetical protein
MTFRSFRRFLRCDIYSCILMTYGPCQRSSEGRPAEPRSRTFATRSRVARRGRAVGPRLFHLSSASLSIPATSAATESAGRGGRGQTCIHRKATAQSDPTREVVRVCQTTVHQRGRQPGLTGAAATRGRSWLSRSRLGYAPYSWSIASIGCWQRNWPRSINCWCPTSACRLPQRGAQRPRHTWR